MKNKSHLNNAYKFFIIIIYLFSLYYGLASESVLCIYIALYSLARSIIISKYVPYMQSMILIWFC